MAGFQGVVRFRGNKVYYICNSNMKSENLWEILKKVVMMNCEFSLPYLML